MSLRVLAIPTLTMLAMLAGRGTGAAQEPDVNRDIAASAFVQAPTVDVPRNQCSTAECHPGIKEHAYLHGPLRVNACDTCHALTDAANHLFEGTWPRQQLCRSCHELPLDDELHLHEPLVQGECLGCHDPHGSEQPRFLLQADRAGMCLACHSGLTGGRRLVHASETSGSCSTCHEAHAAPVDNLLPMQGTALCLACHVETAELLETAHVSHVPATGNCRLCHDPHASSSASMLATDPLTLCTNCHEEVANAMVTAVHPHAAMTADKACLNCHEPHASDRAQLLRGNTSELCFTCHAEPVERAAGGVIPSIEDALDSKPMTHSPAARGECTLCHQVHGSGRARLLAREYAPVYTSFEDGGGYSLCFSCHDRNLVLLGTTASATAFRNGERNLHSVHVGGRKSRSCNICHDPHAADHQHMIRSDFPFGPSRWNLKIGWEATPTGGSCASGCHAVYAYDRVTPIEYPWDTEAETDQTVPGRAPDRPFVPSGEDR